MKTRDHAVAAPRSDRVPIASRRLRRAAGAALALASLWGATAAEAAPIQIYAAGSLRAAMTALVKASGLPASDFAEPVYGASGLLRDRLVKGEKADLFASADMAQPEQLAKTNKDVLIVPFAHNRMCVASMPALGLTRADLIDKLLAPGVRLVTSTPGADPGGDYAMAVFDKADRIHPGAGATLRAKALHLPDLPNRRVAVAGRWPAAAMFLGNEADALISYCSGMPSLLEQVDGLTSFPVPEALEVHPTYGLAILSENPEAARFGLFMLSAAGQAILVSHGFLPIASNP